MELTLTKTGPAAFVGLAGDLAAGTDLGGLDRMIQSIADPAIRAIFLDLATVARLDCTGIGALVRLRNNVGASGRIFGLVNVESKQRRMLEMVRLASVLGVHDSLSAAMMSVPPAAPPAMARPEVNSSMRFCPLPRHFDIGHDTGLALV